jgi:hypothetical protein
MRWKRFCEILLEEMLVTGIAPVEIKTLRPSEATSRTEKVKDRPLHALWPFDGTTLQAYRDWDGSPSKPRWAQVGVDGAIVDYRNSELAPFVHTPRVSTEFGLSPTEVAFNEIEYLLHAESYAARTASNTTPKKALHLEDATPDIIEQIRAWWKSDVEGSSSIPIIGGPKAQSIELGMTTDANLFISWQTHLIAIIASAFGVDVAKANLIVGLNRSTGDKMDDVTDEGSVQVLSDVVADYVNQYIVALYDLDGIAEFRFIYATSMSDLKQTAVANQVELQDDSLTINEARRRRGDGPLLHPITDEDIGNVTLSMYREWTKIPDFLTKGLAGLEDSLKRTVEQADKTLEETSDNASGDDKAPGENENNTSDDPAQRGGNGVYSAPKPKDKPMNQRNDADLDMT